MADEGSVTAKLTIEKSGTKLSVSYGDIKFDVTGKKFVQARQEIPTTEEALALGEVAVGGWFIAINRDSENYVEIKAASSAAALVKLLPGEPCLFRTSTAITSLRAIANTAAVQLEYAIFDA